MKIFKSSIKTIFLNQLISVIRILVNHLSTFVLGIPVLCIVAPISVNAQTGASALEEITVTARKREESLQDTPIAVTAFGAVELEERNLTDVGELAGFTPNVAINRSSRGGGGPSINTYIRGVGQDDFLFTTDPGVGLYIDGVYHPRTVGGLTDLLDIERVEVLRGPQGTLFGKNTVGGGINVVSAVPTGEFGGKVQVTLGNLDRVNVRGTIDFPLIEDKLFGKVAFSSKNRDGFGDRLDIVTGRVVEEGLGDEGQNTVRGKLRWLLNDELTVDLSADYSKWDQNSVPYGIGRFDTTNAVPTQLWNLTVGGPAGTPYDNRYLITGDNVDDSFSVGGPNIVTYEGWGVNATIQWELGWATAKSITAYREFDTTFGFDGDGSPLPIAETRDEQTQNQVSQEFQLIGNAFEDRLHWQVGFFYFDEFGRDINDVDLTSGLFNGLEAFPGPVDGSPLAAPTAPGGPGNPINVFLDLDLDIFNEIDIKSMAAFTQMTYDLTDRLSVTAGIRYTKEEKDYTLEHERLGSGTFIVPLTTISDSWNEFTPMANVQFQFTENLMGYATYSEGFKSGGFNGRPVESAAVESFDPEFVTSYEIGFKSEWFDNTLRVNTALFFMDYEELQINTISNSPTTGTLILRTDNVGAAEIEGVELEVLAIPLEGLNIGANLGYMNATITEIEASVVGVSTATELIRTPEWTISAFGQYKWSWQNYGDFRLRLDWLFEDESYTNIENTPELIRRAHAKLNASLSFEMPSSGWQLTLFGTNLTDKRVIEAGTDARNSFGHVSTVHNQPRQWGVTLSKSF